VCEALSFTLREGRRLRVFENMVLRRIFMSKKDEVSRKWRNYIIRKMVQISENNSYNRAGTKTQNTCDEYKYSYININIKEIL